MCPAHETGEREPDSSTDSPDPVARATGWLPERAQQTGTTPREERALRRVRATSRVLDEAVRVPGTDFRVGLDPVLGVLPVGGDAVSAALSLYPVAEAYRFDLPRLTIAKMLLLVAVDAVVGSVPVLGTVFDAVWKANEWNRRTLERHLGAE